MSVDSLGPQDIEDAIHRLAAHKNFERANPHLTLAHRMGILASPPVWPRCPVFSPYAATHHGYTQSINPLESSN